MDLNSINSDTIINLDSHLNYNIKIIYTHPMDFKTYKNYKTDKWMISKILRILYNIEHDYITNKINYDNHCENEYFTDFENCFEFIWNQILEYFKFIDRDIYNYNFVLKSKDLAFDKFFNDYYSVFLESFC